MSTRRRQSPPQFRNDSLRRYPVIRNVNFRIATQKAELRADERQFLCESWWQEMPLTSARDAWKVLKAFSIFNRNPNWPQCGFNAERQETLERARMILRNENIAIPL